MQQEEHRDEPLPELTVDTLAANTHFIPPSSKHTATVFFLHGYNANPFMFKNYLETVCGFNDGGLRNAGLSHVKWVFPPGIFLNELIDGRAWFRKIGGKSYDAQEQDIKSSRDYLHRLVGKEISDSGIDAHRIILGGFSQGGSISLYSGLTYDGTESLGGLFCLSGRLIRKHEIPAKIKEYTRNIPIFWAHGNPDNVNPFPAGIDLEIRTLLGDDHKRFAFLEFSGIGHGITDLEMEKLFGWIEAQVPKIE